MVYILILFIYNMLNTEQSSQFYLRNLIGSSLAILLSKYSRKVSYCSQVYIAHVWWYICLRCSRWMYSTDISVTPEECVGPRADQLGSKWPVTMGPKHSRGHTSTGLRAPLHIVLIHLLILQFNQTYFLPLLLWKSNSQTTHKSFAAVCNEKGKWIGIFQFWDT